MPFEKKKPSEDLAYSIFSTFFEGSDSYGQLFMDRLLQLSLYCHGPGLELPHSLYESWIRFNVMGAYQVLYKRELVMTGRQNLHDSLA